METLTEPQLPVSVLTKRQTMTYGPRFYKENGDKMKIIAHVRYDDQCNNGHNTFSITGETWRNGREDGGGCIHEEIAKHFPGLAPLIKWHGVSSDGPTHYIANTIYHAGNRDCNGLKAGEFRQHKNKEGVPCWELKTPPKNSLLACSTEVYSHEKPAPLLVEWVPDGRTGEGKKRELDHARSSAVWPDATDEELCQEPEALKAALLSRLPALMQEFKLAVESLGFVY